MPNIDSTLPPGSYLIGANGLVCYGPYKGNRPSGGTRKEVLDDPILGQNSGGVVAVVTIDGSTITPSDIRQSLAIAIEEVRVLAAALGIEAVYIWPNGESLNEHKYSIHADSYGKRCSTVELIDEFTARLAEASLIETMY